MTLRARLAVAVSLLASSPVAALAEGAAEPVTQFVADANLDAMKYRHLLIAYAVIWFLIMAFVARTARRQADLKRDLDALAARVDEMEKHRE